MNPCVYDVIVSGAGPAGCCTAIGLANHGYSVALVERRAFPRSHIGESLSPGIRIVLAFLGIEHVLQRVPRMELLRAYRKWEHQEDIVRQDGFGAFVTDRAVFDHELHEATRDRGVGCFQCSGTLPVWDGKAWLMEAGSSVGMSAGLSAPLWIDARGRRPVVSKQHLFTTPASVAVWEDFTVAPGAAADHSVIEALSSAWLWGAPTTAGRYRVLAVTDPNTLRTESGTSSRSWLRSVTARSRLLPSFTRVEADAPHGQCAAGAYVDRDSWGSNSIKVGDAAFALDPLSSGGVEKAMRHALQCVVAVRTMCEGGESSVSLAREFYLSSLAESVVHHARSSQECYRISWAASEPFWRRRGAPVDDAHLGEDGGPLALQLLKQLMLTATPLAEDISEHQSQTVGPEILLRGARVRLSSDASLIDTICVVDGKAIAGTGVWRPGMIRPVAYVDGVRLAALVADLQYPADLQSVLLTWSSMLSKSRAMETMQWLLRTHLLQVFPS